MQIVESYKNKKSNRQNYISRNKSTKASPSVATANVVINVELATQRLNELLNTYEEKSDWNNPRGFLTDLRTALSIPNTKGASKYGVVKNEAFTASISLTNHNSNAQTYIDANANYPYNLRLLIRKRYRKNTFKPNKDVTLEEYVYFGSDLAKCTVGNPYQLIIKSIIDFLHNGTYIDSTGVARKNTSPAVNNTNESKTRKDMKTNRIKLTEAQLKQMVSEAVRNVLKEGIDSQEERINAAVEALMSVREIVSRASDCWEYEDVNAPLFQQICAASSAIEGVMGFSRYGSDIRQQRNLEMSQQD